MRRLLVAVCTMAMLAGCGGDGPPSSVFNAGGYHVRGDKVYYLESFPGKAFEVEGADAASFEVFDQTFARDGSTVYYTGRPLEGADAPSFAVLDRPGFAKDRRHVYQNGNAFSDDPAHFELLAGDLSKDSGAVYWSDGSVLSTDPTHFAIVSDRDHYLFTKDGTSVQVNGKPIAGADPSTFRVLQGAYSRDDRVAYYFDGAIAGVDLATLTPLEGPYARDAVHVYWMGQSIDGADPATFRVLNADFECSADGAHAYYRKTVVRGADPGTFPPGRAVTNCDETSISFAE